MRAPALVQCAGAPRDLGLDQGRALRDEIRADARAAGFAVADDLRSRLRALRRDASPARVALARDVARHFPHLAERVAGLAAGAGLAPAAFLDAFLRELDPHASDALRCEGGADGGVLVLHVAEPLPLTGFAVRECAPDGGYRNLGLVRPSHVAALAGVNERGLAGVVVPLAAPAADERCVAPGALLLDQCIERLDAVEKALDWCEHRPGGGRALLLFADATGAAAALEIDGDKRRRRALPPATGAGLAVRVDAAARALAVDGAGGAPTRFALAPAS